MRQGRGGGRAIAAGVVGCVGACGFAGARVVGRRLCMAVFAEREGFYRGLCVWDVAHWS